jgi:hypothetical protein
MFTRCVLVALVALGCGLPARGADLARMKRYLIKEPAYQSAPKYCLLVFGKEAATRVWLVLDGNTLYVDRNANLDLTDPGEKLTSPHGPNFTIDRLVERDGTVHPNLWVRSLGDTFTLTLGDDQRRQFVGIGKMERPTWGARPEEAPIIHFNGPMTLERYGPLYTLPRIGFNPNSRQFKLRLLLGTPGLGKGSFASYDDVCSENLGPIQADIEYPSGKPSGEPIKQRVELLHDG